MSITAVMYYTSPSLYFKALYVARPITFVLTLSLLAGCSPTRWHVKALHLKNIPAASFNIVEERFTSFDGASLGLSVWEAENTSQPEYIVIGVHGMNDYAQAFQYAGPYWAERGVTTYAYDQRGFGRSEARGLWPKEELMREDLRTAVKIARQKHPNAIMSVVGISMGAAVAMTTFSSDVSSTSANDSFDQQSAHSLNTPSKTKETSIDRLILSGPGLRGWGGLPWSHRISLWVSSSVRPSWVVVPPKFIVKEITPSDNYDMLVSRGRDELNLLDNRIDQVYGVVSLMENGHKAAPHLPKNTLMLYGAQDDIIPEYFMRRTAPNLASHVRTAYYKNGYHMLMRDLQRENVLEDQLAFMREPSAPLPSEAPPIPWAPVKRSE